MEAGYAMRLVIRSDPMDQGEYRGTNMRRPLTYVIDKYLGAVLVRILGLQPPLY
jgi:hypothetical protein